MHHITVTSVYSWVSPNSITWSPWANVRSLLQPSFQDRTWDASWTQTLISSKCHSTDTHVMVKEWAAYKGKSPHTPELVEALPFREWTCPNLKKLWLGKAVEDKNRRMRAFLACMRSDTPAMLNPANVPTPLLVLCCVLRWVDFQQPGRSVALCLTDNMNMLMCRREVREGEDE